MNDMQHRYDGHMHVRIKTCCRLCNTFDITADNHLNMCTHADMQADLKTQIRLPFVCVHMQYLQVRFYACRKCTTQPTQLLTPVASEEKCERT